jgi:hypothetical protein
LGGARRLSAVGDDEAMLPLPPDVERLVEALEVELGDDDLAVKAMALRLARLSAGTGPASVSALRGLGELLTTIRGPQGQERTFGESRTRSGSGRRKRI